MLVENPDTIRETRSRRDGLLVRLKHAWEDEALKSIEGDVGAMDRRANLREQINDVEQEILTLTQALPAAESRQRAAWENELRARLPGLRAAYDEGTARLDAAVATLAATDPSEDDLLTLKA